MKLMGKGKDRIWKKEKETTTIKMSRCKELPKCMKQCVKLYHPLFGGSVEKEHIAKDPSKSMHTWNKIEARYDTRESNLLYY